MRLTKERRKILEDAILDHNGIVKMNHVFKIYSSKKAAKNAVKTIESYNYIKFIKPGYFKVIELPEELEHLENHLKKQKEQKITSREFTKEILRNIFHRIKLKNPRIDKEEVKYATKTPKHLKN